MLLECRNITYQYAELESSVLDNLNFALKRPGFHGLFGPSGVGKSTLAKILAGEVSGFSGDIIKEGEIVKESAVRILYSYNLERLPGWSSVGDHIAKVIPTGRHETMRELFHFFGLESCLESRFAQISLGQKNRANLIRYLLQDFDLLIMDESLANVDEAMREQIILTIKKMFPNKYFLYISHAIVEVSTFCRDIYVMRGGRKQPQIINVSGLDRQENQPLQHKDLERTMLEVVNAA